MFPIIFLISFLVLGASGQVEQCFAGIDDGLRLSYSFAGNTRDSSANGRDGGLHGPSLAKDRFGRQDNAYSLDGFDDWLDVDEEGSNCLLNYDSDWSVNMWVYLDGTGKHSVFFAGADGDSGARQFAMASQYVKLTHKSDTESDWRVNFKELGHDTWHMYTVTWDRVGHLRVYVDSVLQGEDTTGELADFCPDNKPIIGAVNFFRKTQFFKGRVDDLRIYDRVLTAGEIIELFSLSE